MPKPREYIVRNYDALNAHAEGVVANEKQLRRLKRFRVDRFWIRNAGMLMLAIGLFAILLATAYYIYKKYSTVVPGPVKIERVVVEVPGPVKIVRVEVEVPIPAPDAVNNKPSEPVVIYRDKLVPVPGPIKIVIKKVPMRGDRADKRVTVWSKYIVNKDGVGKVITGSEYLKWDSSFPTFQYCYATPQKSKANNSLDTNLDLGQRRGLLPVEWVELTEEDARQFNTTVAFLEGIKVNCDFESEKDLNARRVASSSSGPITKYPVAPPSSKSLGSGSGFYVNGKGSVLTNNHVVDKCSKVWVKYNNKDIPGRVVHTKEEHDLAVIETSQDNEFYVKFSKFIDPVEDVMALGFPRVDLLGGEMKRNKGNISSLTGIQGDDFSLQHTALIQKGSSGGPLLNNKGSVVGVNYAKFKDKDLQGIGLAIQAVNAVTFLGDSAIDFEMSESEEKMDWTEVYKQGKKFTVRVMCEK
jgi:S1-C subfamily serine protease